MLGRRKIRLRSIYRSLSGFWRSGEDAKSRCISLKTSSPARGNVLIAYILDPFLKSGEPVACSHTHHIESLLIAQSFLDLGYNIDVIDYRNRRFNPRKKYSFFVSARTFLEVIASRLNPECIIIAHLDTSHFLFNNHAAYGRALALQARRGVTCDSLRIIESNKAIERADYAVVLGNQATMDTYRYSGKKLYPVPVPAALTYQYLRRDYNECRKNFLWFGSSGFVHKGLDLVLEAFLGMPDCHLYVCGPIEEDARFCQIFRKELFETPNIHTIGWVDIASTQFRDLARKCIGHVYPSCAEGQAGSAVVCMHAGLIPLLSKETGINVQEFGIVMEDCRIEEIRTHVARIASLSKADLEYRTRQAWEYARAIHTKEYYLSAYRRFMAEIIRANDAVEHSTARTGFQNSAGLTTGYR